MKVNNKKEIRSVTPRPNKRKNLTAITFPSLASITLAACGGGGGGPIVQPPPTNRAPVAEANKTLTIDYQNTLLVDGDDPIDLVQQPLEYSMVTVDLVADFLILDDYDATLDHDMLFWSSELGYQ